MSSWARHATSGARRSRTRARERAATPPPMTGGPSRVNPAVLPSSTEPLRWSAEMPDRVVEEELQLLAEVNARLEASAAPVAPSEASVVRELEHLRGALRDGAKTEDRAALLQQWDRQSALLRQLRTAARPVAVDAASPYFAHMRLAEASGEHDILLGKTTRMLDGLAIVDWRNAPVSRLFYRYRQGEEYEEEIAGRARTGCLRTRRTVTIRDRELRRVEAPEGTFQMEAAAPDGWERLAAPAPRLGGGEGAALRAHDVAPGEHGRLGTRPPGLRPRADKHLPDIVGLIDAAQFALITK